MGLFDVFKKRKERPDVKANEQNLERTFEVKYGTTGNGELQIDYEDKRIKVGQMYDTTRLIINGETIELAGRNVHNCKVSWYSQDEEVFNDPQYCGEPISANEYREVLAELDTDLLQNDPDYCSKVMKSLLQKSRVEKYLDDGLNEDPEVPCGNYIGGVTRGEKGYNKFFSVESGRASHYSATMIDNRRKFREEVEKDKEKRIEAKTAEIERLKQEIEDMSK